jgi:hypothetical protein
MTNADADAAPGPASYLNPWTQSTLFVESIFISRRGSGEEELRFQALIRGCL